MDKTALLKKIRALAEHGVGGEAENAEKLLARMMKKYGISEAELDEETRVRHDFTYRGGGGKENPQASGLQGHGRLHLRARIYRERAQG